MDNEQLHGWFVTLDGETDGRFPTRAAAREYAGWLRRHPEVRDRARYAGVGAGGVAGTVRVVDRRR